MLLVLKYLRNTYFTLMVKSFKSTVIFLSSQEKKVKVQYYHKQIISYNPELCVSLPGEVVGHKSMSASQNINAPVKNDIVASIFYFF